MRDILLPRAIKDALEAGAALAISLSGGKDSQAMLEAVMRARREHGWLGEVFCIHSDLGRAEAKESLPMCAKMAHAHDLELTVVQRSDGMDLLDRIRHRKNQLEGTGKPFWPSAASRYCTGGSKTENFDRYFRQFPLIVSAEGLRAEESAKRSKQPPCVVRTKITTERLKRLSPREAFREWGGEGRLAYSWYPIQDWTISDVWTAIGTSARDLERRRALFRDGSETEALDGWPAHPTYVYGNERCSCSLCVLATLGDLKNGVRHNPQLAEAYAQMEDETGCTFRPDVSIRALIAGTSPRRHPDAPNPQADLFAA